MCDGQQTTLISIDPGTNKCGIALWTLTPNEAFLTETALLRPTKKSPMEAVFAEFIAEKSLTAAAIEDYAFDAQMTNFRLPEFVGVVKYLTHTLGIPIEKYGPAQWKSRVLKDHDAKPPVYRMRINAMPFLSSKGIFFDKSQEDICAALGIGLCCVEMKYGISKISVHPLYTNC